MASRSNPNLPTVTSTLPALALANDLAGQIALNVGRYLTLGLEGAEDTHLAYLANLRRYRSLLCRT
ncbi:MAG: hypothetical protein ACRYG7_11660 [Janthinobacterium lividum]